MAYSDALLNAIRTARQVAGVPVTYRQGGVSVEVTAVVGKHPFRVDEPEGGALYIETRDYLVAQADLVHAGQPIEPRDGDRIEEAGRVYQVVSVGGEPPYRWSDPAQQELRIHTQLVA